MGHTFIQHCIHYLKFLCFIKIIYLRYIIYRRGPRSVEHCTIDTVLIFKLIKHLNSSRAGYLMCPEGHRTINRLFSRSIIDKKEVISFNRGSSNHVHQIIHRRCCQAQHGRGIEQKHERLQESIRESSNVCRSSLRWQTDQK